MSSIGVDISSNKVVVVEMSSTRRGFAIDNASIIEIEPEVISRGEIQDTTNLSKQLITSWNLNKFKNRKVIVGITTQRAIAKEIDIPTLNDKELQQSIKYQISDYLPISADNVIYDYYIMGRSDSNSKVMLTGVIKSIVDKVVDCFKKAKLNVEAIDLNCFSLFRLINHTRNFGLKKNKDNDLICIFHFGWEVSILGIIKDNDLRKPRFSTIAKKTIIDNLCKKLQKSPEECIKIIDSFDFSAKDVEKDNKASESPDDNDEKEKKQSSEKYFDITENTVENKKPVFRDKEDAAERVRESINKTADQLVYDIELTIENFLQEDRRSSIDTLVLTGERIKGLEEYIAKKIRYPVERLNLLDYFSIDSIKKRPMFKNINIEEIADDLTIGVGLAIRGLM